jgi:hypothetical protein
MFAGALQAQSMFGNVTDAVTRKPISGAVVTLAEISKTFTTDTDGYYSADSVGEGTFTVKITAPRYFDFSKKVILASLKEAGISDLEFNPGLYNFSSAVDTSEGVVPITYQFPTHGDVEFVIKNARGKTIRTMFDRSRTGGVRSASWNGKNDNGNFVPAGSYTCTVSSPPLVIVCTLVWKGAAEDAPPSPVQQEKIPAEPPLPEWR